MDTGTSCITLKSFHVCDKTISCCIVLHSDLLPALTPLNLSDIGGAELITPILGMGKLWLKGEEHWIRNRESGF